VAPAIQTPKNKYPTAKNKYPTSKIKFPGKRGGGIRVFRGNKKTIMREDNLEEPAKKLDGLQHDVLDEEFQRKLDNEVAMDEMDEQALERAW
jgi:hypothetical protein